MFLAVGLVLVSCSLEMDPVQFSGIWIGCESPSDDIASACTQVPARYLRKEFRLKSGVRSARLAICGLGLYDAWVNGEYITSGQVLSPTVSDYDKTVYYNVFDLTEKLTRGDNVLAVRLGNGRYVSVRTYDPISIIVNRHFGMPCLLCQLDVLYEDGSLESFCSDSSWKITADGPIRSNNEYDGEIYDARMELGDWTSPGYDDSLWDDATAMPGPSGELLEQPNPNIAIQDVLHPVSITKRGDSYILDMGQNMVGWLQFKASGLFPGDEVKLSFAETLSEDGTLYRANLRRAKVRDIYIANGSGEVVWHPEYTYHGFRYVEIEGLRNEPSLDDFEGQVLYDKMDVTGHFRTSNPVINQVYKNAFWGIRGNYRGMPTDCPQRDERQGWMGDRTTGCYGESYMFDNHLLYAKWLRDIRDSQTPDGSLPNVAPRFWQVDGDNLTWPGVFITAADMMWRRFGDKQPIVDNYDAMKQWLAHIKATCSEGDIIVKDVYGDWCMPPESLELIHSKDPSRITSAAVLSTTFYYHLLGLMAQFAPIAGHRSDAKAFLAEAENVRKAFNDRYFNPEKGCYDNNTVTANLLPLFFGMVPEGREKDVFAQIVYKTEVECSSHVSTGVVGIQFLMRTLTEYGRADLAYRIASADTYPSWGYMAANGATTIWELWNGNTAAPFMNSGNHVMLLGDLIIWEYEYLAGIRALEPGYKSIEFKPYPVGELSFVECSFDSVRGRIVSNWKIENGKFFYDIEVPRGCRATVLLPEPDGGRKVKKVRSGKHHFEVPYWTVPRPEAKEVDKVLSFISSSWDKTVRSNTEDCPPRLGLPEPYTVPSISGAFQELYYWDTFFTNEGLMMDGKLNLARSNVENMLYLVEKYGKMLNGSAVWFLNRSQPPFLSLMVRSIYEKTGDREWLKKVLPSLEKEYAFWMNRRMTPCGLNRYGNESSDSEKLEFIKLLKSRFGESFSTEGLSEADLLEIGSHYVSEAESGWDFTPRFDGRCEDFCPVDLNALLYSYEKNFAWFSRELGENGDGWDKIASNRCKLMRKLMRDPSSGMFYDYEFAEDRRSEVSSSAVFALLFCMIITL